MTSKAQLKAEETAYNEHMDKLANRISFVMDGEDPAEVILACCGVIHFALKQVDEKRREKLTTCALDFLRQITGRNN